MTILNKSIIVWSFQLELCEFSVSEYTLEFCAKPSFVYFMYHTTRNIAGLLFAGISYMWPDFTNQS